MLKRVKGMALLVLGLTIAAGAVTWLHAQQARKGVLTTQDYIDIQMLYARYNWTIDSGDAEAYAALYTPDGSFNTFNGHDGLVQFMKGRNGGATRHWNSGLLITPTPEGAAGKVYLVLVNVNATPPAIATAAQYDDTLVKTPQGWRFKTRKTSRQGPPPAPAPQTPQ